jgi:hypothetical protein
MSKKSLSQRYCELDNLIGSCLYWRDPKRTDDLLVEVRRLISDQQAQIIKLEKQTAHDGA